MFTLNAECAFIELDPFSVGSCLPLVRTTLDHGLPPGLGCNRHASTGATGEGLTWARFGP